MLSVGLVSGVAGEAIWLVEEDEVAVVLFFLGVFLEVFFLVGGVVRERAGALGGGAAFLVLYTGLAV